ncbi:MAG: 4-phosphoerythronate dehydrogenase, partial [Thiopseudomonas sp.]
LAQQGIAWSNAPGCNARSVVEYVLAALRRLALQRQASLERRCYGIVGAGEVGQRLANVLRALGWQVVLCDPP